MEAHEIEGRIAGEGVTGGVHGERVAVGRLERAVHG